MPISAFLPKSGHTFCYISKQITNDISGDSPTSDCPINGTQTVTHLGISQLFCLPSVGAQIMTHLGISHLFCCPSIGTQIVTLLGISQHFRPHRFATNRDVFNYIQLICHRFCKRTIGTLIVTPLQYPKQNNSSGLSQFSNQS